jgi:hypothetical protein
VTHIIGTPVTSAPPVLAITVPVGVTAGMVGLIVLATADGVDWDPVPVNAAAVFTLIDDRAATNMRVTLWTATGLEAGAVIGFTATSPKQATVEHVWQDEYAYRAATVSAAVRSGSVATCVTGALTPAAAGQTVAVVALERTTATGTTVVSAVSSGAEAITQRHYAEALTTVTSVYLGTFVASAASSRTATVTYNSGSTNGYAALIGAEPLGQLAAETFSIADASPWPSGAGSVGALGLDPTAGGGGATVVGGRGVLTTGNGLGYLGSKRVSRRANILARASAVYECTVIFNGSEVYPRIYVRASGTLIDGAGGYYLEFSPNVGGWNISYAVAFAGPPDPLVEEAFTFTTGVPYRIIFGVVDTAIKLQIWRADQAQPTEWTTELIDTTISGTGTVGITVGAGNAANTSISIDDVIVRSGFPALPAVERVQYTSAVGVLSPAVLWYTSAPDTLSLPAEVRPVPDGPGTVAAWLAGTPFYLAHRGGSAVWPEMSLHAYTQAVNWGLGALEISVARTSDGVLFGLHDETLDRTSGTTGFVAAEHMWAEVQEHLIAPPDGSPTLAGKPYARLSDICDAYPGHVLFVDPKYLTAPQRSELLAYLLTLPAATDRIVWRYFGPATDRAAEGTAAGLTTWGYYYEVDDVPATAGSWDLLGMDYAASQGAWDEITALGKPVIGHVVTTGVHANTALARGADGLQVAGVTAVVPRA